MKLRKILSENKVWINSYNLPNKQDWKNLEIITRIRNFIMDEFDIYTNSEFENFLLKKSKTLTIPIDKINLGQPSVDSNKIEHFVKTINPNNYPPVFIFKFKNKYYLFNGYHRLTALFKTGNYKIKSYVFDVDANIIIK